MAGLSEYILELELSAARSRPPFLYDDAMLKDMYSGQAGLSRLIRLVHTCAKAN